MKKVFLIITIILYGISALAVPAKPGVHTYIQPDGTVIRLEHHGDEFFHWTTIAGTDQVVSLDENGYWRKTIFSNTLKKEAAKRRTQENEKRALSLKRTHNDNPMTHGPRHIPVLLVAFSDLDFSISNPAQQFDYLLNLHGYSLNGGTGSVQDYYMDNSKGQFQPIFDVYGPVTLPHDMKYYGEPVKDSNGNIIVDDKAAAEALRDACILLDDQIDFSLYDYDNDGYVDMTLFYYAGYNTAEWGPDDAIWPHQGFMGGANIFDGKGVERYFCTSELKGDSGTNMCGIGTTCHEFGHSLGLPDFYDTDYNKNGSSSALGYFSIMCSGSYNNDGRTPPYFNAEERIFLGWMTDNDLLELPQGDISFGSIINDVAYTTPTTTEGEYFLYECRDGIGWDAYIPQGLLVYHVDKSPDSNVHGMSALKHWTDWEYYNDINMYGDHPCFYVVPASAQTSLSYNEAETGKWVFPGDDNVTSYAPIDWVGANTVRLSNISYSDGTVSFNTAYVAEKALIGTVTDYDGKPIEGAYVVLSQLSDPSSVQGKRKLRKTSSIVLEAMTDENGSFRISIEAFGADKGRLTCSKEGYKTSGTEVSLDKRINRVTVLMGLSGGGNIFTYSYFDPQGAVYVYGEETYAESQMAAIRIPASRIPEKGGTITSVSLQAAWRAQNYYLIVDSGDERLYTVPITPSRIDFLPCDLSGVDLKVPGGKDLYVGIGIDQASGVYSGYEGYLFYATMGGGNFYYDELNLERSNWKTNSDNIALMIEVKLTEEVEQGVDDGPKSFAEMGIPSISDPGQGSYSVGDVFNLEVSLPAGLTVTDTTWHFDGQPVDAPVTLQAGQHTVKATLRYSDGSEEVFELILKVS